MKTISWCLGLCVVSSVAGNLLGPAWVRAADRLVLLDGKKIEATIESIDAKGRLTGAGIDQAIDLQGLRQMTHSVPSDEKLKPQSELHLLGGGMIRCTSLTMIGESFALKWKYGELTLPLDAVRAGKFASEGNPADTQQGREALIAAIAKDDDKDHLLTVVDGKVQDLAGLLVEYDGKHFSFEWNGQTRQIVASKVYGLVLAEVGTSYDSIGECTVQLREGSTVSGRVQQLADGKLRIKLTDDLVVDLPWDDVVIVKVRSDRMVFLSDMKPLEARHTPVVTLQRPWQANRNVIGGKLKLGQRSFEKGIGVQSLSKLVFAVDRRFDTVAATIGIDRSAEGRGDCEFVVLADGKEVFRQRMRGTDEPREIRIKTKNVERITLLVEPGENLDLSDYANWCEARLLRSGADN